MTAAVTLSVSLQLVGHESLFILINVCQPISEDFHLAEITVVVPVGGIKHSNQLPSTTNLVESRDAFALVLTATVMLTVGQSPVSRTGRH